MANQNAVADLVEQVVEQATEVVEAPVTPDAGAVTEPVEDWKGKVEAAEQKQKDAEARLTKERQDWRSQKNELLITQNELRTKRNQENMVAKIAKKLGVDASSIEEDVNEITATAEGERAQIAAADDADSLARSVSQIATDGGVSLKSDDAALVRRLWELGKSKFNSGDVEGGMREFREAEGEMKDTIERVKRRTEREAAVAKERDEKQEAIDSGAADLSGPRGQGSAKSVSWAQAQKITKVSDLSDGDYLKLIS